MRDREKSTDQAETSILISLFCATLCSDDQQIGRFMVTSAHNDSAKVFMSGKSQAVRLPKKYRFAEGCDEVSIRQVGRSLILSPRFADWDEFWANTPPFDDDMVKEEVA